MPHAPTTAAKGKATIAEAAPAPWVLAGGGGGSQSHGRRQSGDGVGTSCKAPGEGAKPMQRLCPAMTKTQSGALGQSPIQTVSPSPGYY